jgi:hypothetical protein
MVEELKQSAMLNGRPNGFREADKNIDYVRRTYMQRFREQVGMADCPESLPTAGEDP